MILGKLLPCGGGVAIPLTKPSLVVGRNPECDITIACNSVSSRHCLLEFEDGWWWIRDLESRNGTGVNGRRISKQRIAPQDIVTIGRQRLVIVYQATKKIAAIAARREREEDLALNFLNEEVAEKKQAPTNPIAGIPTMELSAEAVQRLSNGVLQSSVPKSPTTKQGSQHPPVESELKPSLPQNVLPPSIPQDIPPRPAVPALPTTPSSPTVSTPTRNLGPELGKLLPSGGGAPIPLRAPELVLGRSPECDIRIRFPSVSSRHCKLSFDKGYWLVEDLNSTNGTWVDGDRCMLQCLLPDSVLALDKHRFTMHYLLRTDGPPPVIKRLFTQSLLEKAGLANQFAGDHLAGRPLPEDEEERPKRYNLLESGDESR